MAKVLIIYSTTDGHTRSICERLQGIIEGLDQSVDVLWMTEHADVDITQYDKVVVGASIRYGKHQPQVFDFIRRNHATLDSRPNAFFTVNVVARKPEKNTPATNPYMQKFLPKIDWQPQHLAVFAGRLDFPKYSYFDRQMIRLIMWMTKGPTAPDTVVEFTDWDKVEEFGRTIAAM